MRTAVLLALAAAAGWPLPAQSFGTISGTVLNAVSGAALASSTVTLAAPDGSPLQAVTADRRGRYLFTGLEPGHYTVRASRAYFLPGRHGQKAWNHIGTAIALAPGAALTADVRLHRLGAVSGTVVDENGEGFPNVTVQAVTVESRGVGGRVSSSSITDDRGMFRIAGLKPGRYFVVTAPRQMEDGTGYLPTYYPGVTDPAEAQIVSADIDSETAGLRMQPAAGRLVRLIGGLPAAAKFRDSEVTVTLFRDEESRQVTAGPAGQFAFSGIAPGRYTLITEVRSSQARLASYQELALHGDIEGLVIEPSPAPALEARLIDENGAPVSDPQVLLYAARIENGARTAPVQLEPAGAPGAYRSGGLMPGRWRFFVVAPESYALHSVSVGEENGLEGFVLAPGRGAVAVIGLSRRAASVRGQVMAAGQQPVAGAPVVCYPLDSPNRARLGGFRSLRANSEGEYRIAGLPEGEYLLLAVPFENFDPEPQLEEWKSRGAVIRVTGGREAAHNLRLLE